MDGRDSQIRGMLDAIMQAFGPKLAIALMGEIGGDAARSELDTLAEPLKKLVVSQPKAKEWLNASLYSDQFQSRIVGDAEKKVFLQKIIRLIDSTTAILCPY